MKEGREAFPSAFLSHPKRFKTARFRFLVIIRTRDKQQSSSVVAVEVDGPKLANLKQGSPRSSGLRKQSEICFIGRPLPASSVATARAARPTFGDVSVSRITNPMASRKALRTAGDRTAVRRQSWSGKHALGSAGPAEWTVASRRRTRSIIIKKSQGRIAGHMMGKVTDPVQNLDDRVRMFPTNPLNVPLRLDDLIPRAEKNPQGYVRRKIRKTCHIGIERSHLIRHGLDGNGRHHMLPR